MVKKNIDKSSILIVFDKIELVHHYHEIKHPKYYNIFSMKRDCLNVFLYINNLLKGLNLRKYKNSEWRLIPKNISLLNDVKSLEKMYYKLLDVCRSLKKEIEKVI